MEALSVWHIIILLVIWFGVFGIPASQVIRKAGYSPVWILIMFVPIVGVVFLWIFAFSRWPIEEHTGK